MVGLNLQLKKKKKPNNKTCKQALPGRMGSALDFSGADGAGLGTEDRHSPLLGLIPSVLERRKCLLQESRGRNETMSRQGESPPLNTADRSSRWDKKKLMSGGHTTSLTSML